MAMRTRSFLLYTAALGLLLQLVPGTLVANDRQILDQSRLTESVPERELQTVSQVNDFFNGFSRISDKELWGRVDYWAAPDELLRIGAGDCEDLAIAKYFALREAGVKAHQLRLAYGQAYRAEQGRVEAHIVLLYRNVADQAWLVLDNLSETLDPLWARGDLKLTLSFNEYQVGFLRGDLDEQIVGTAGVLAPWADLMARHSLLRGSASAR